MNRSLLFICLISGGVFSAPCRGVGRTADLDSVFKQAAAINVPSAASAEEFVALKAGKPDSDDIANIKIYTGQGYLVNQLFRDLIPLPFLEKYLDPRIAKTCSAFIKSEAAKKGSVPYFNRILVSPTSKIEPRDTKLFLLVNNALERLPKYPGTFYRGTMSCGFIQNDDGAFKPAFVEKAFLSTSESRKTAERFTRWQNDTSGGEPKGCLAVISSRSGRKIYDITDNYNDEREVLFPLNTAFRLVRTEKTGERTTVELEEIDQASDAGLVETVNSELYLKSLRERFPGLTGPGSDAVQQAKARGELSDMAEYACRESYKFFTTDTKARAAIDKKQPVYDLKNKKLNPDDYAAEE